LVRRWAAAADRRHERVAQGETVAAMGGRRLIGEPGGVQRREEEVAAAIAGEHPAGAVPAVRGGSEADQPEACVPIAETRNGAAPVLLVAELAALGLCDRFAVRNQARAAAAIDDRPFERAPARGRAAHRRAGAVAALTSLLTTTTSTAAARSSGDRSSRP